MAPLKRVRHFYRRMLARMYPCRKVMLYQYPWLKGHGPVEARKRMIDGLEDRSGGEA